MEPDSLSFLTLITKLQSHLQCAKKVVSDSPGLVDFAIGLVNPVFNLPNRQVCFLRNLNNRRTVKSIVLVRKFLGLVEMTSGLVNASFSLPEWQAVKMIFFAPCIWHSAFCIQRSAKYPCCNSFAPCQLVVYN